MFNPDNIPAQKRRQLFVKRGSTVWHDRGFSSKFEADSWINNFGRALDWRAGFIFRLRGDDTDIEIVDRQGKRIRP